jgi:pimeloyl-ACP methyl ester carboxylesterase
MTMQRQAITLGHRERGTLAQTWLAGAGRPVLLLHGAWAGARAHWSTVWDALAVSHRVIAPELPGFFPHSGEPKHHYEDYADWAAELLDSLGSEPAVVIGNSFGACVAWYLAMRHPERCRALVLVDGGPPPPIAPWLRALLSNTPLRRLVRRRMLQDVFGPKALRTGFAHRDRAPSEVQHALHSGEADQVDHLIQVFLRSAVPAGTPSMPTTVVWGEQDHLPQSDLAAGRALQSSLPGSRFEAIADAGHLPQVEQPERFLQAIAPAIA